VEQSWDAISVQNICDRADVARSTFYTHFADKEELLAGGLEDLGKALARLRASPAARADPLGFVRGLIDHAHERRDLFRALVGQRSGHPVYWRFRTLVISLVRQDLAGVVTGRLPVEAVSHYVAGAFLELLTWWIDGGTDVSPAGLETIFRRMTAPVLAAARR